MITKKILVAQCPCCKAKFSLRGKSKREINPEHPDNAPTEPVTGPVPTMPPELETELFKPQDGEGEM